MESVPSPAVVPRRTATHSSGGSGGDDPSHGGHERERDADPHKRTEEDEPHHRYREKQETALQKHIAFFDANRDGVVTWIETYRGFRALGFNIPASLYAATVIHLCMGYATAPSWWPTISIYIKNIARARHGSDSQVYDERGHFSEEKFHKMMSRYDTDRDGFLSRKELINMIFAQRSAFDPFGWFAACLEWGFFWFLVRQPLPHNKTLFGAKIDHVRGQFDGSLFYAIAADREVHSKKAPATPAPATPHSLPMPAPAKDL